jgi:hypothetical protein
MYNNEKERELANLVHKLCKNIQTNNKFEKIADNLLANANEEKACKLKNYIKIIVNSTTIKQEALFYPFSVIDSNIKEPEKGFSLEELYDMETMLLIVFATYELMIYKSKELKNDIRLKLVQELVTELEVLNRKLSFNTCRVLTKFIEG